MSNNNNERRELTAAELDLVAGGYTLENALIVSNLMDATNKVSPSGLQNSESVRSSI